MERALQLAQEVLSRASRVAVLTGAGISTDSGIPDFRGPNGLWTQRPDLARRFQLSDYLADPQLRVDAWKSRSDHPAWQARPNAGHHSLVQLHRAGLLTTVITQNIDGLHQAAGLPEAAVLEIHGSIRNAVCVECGLVTPMKEVLERVRAGEPDPSCSRCGGIQKSATISFGQQLDADVLLASARAARDCDAFLAIGTSLRVQPAASLCDVAVASGAQVIIINAEPTPYDDRAVAVLRAPIADVLPQLCSAALSNSATA